jgi:hypothetical protein
MYTSMALAEIGLHILQGTDYEIMMPGNERSKGTNERLTSHTIGKTGKKTMSDRAPRSSRSHVITSYHRGRPSVQTRPQEKPEHKA